MWNPSSPVTGAAQTGFTSPTYTLVDDTAPTANGKQKAISVAGGTQAGFVVHSVSRPFTVTFVRPGIFKPLGKANPVTGVVASVPRNPWSILTRKAVLPLAGQPYQTMTVRTVVEVPAGADIADPTNVQAALSLHIGILTQQAAGIGDSALAGTM
jgi:hypothetical protein